MISFALILMTLPSRVAEVRARRAGGPAGSHISSTYNAVTSLDGERLQRWRPANGRIPGAMPQATIEKAPSALNRCRSYSTGASDPTSKNSQKEEP
jgi:hypothetical protein